MRSDDSMKIAIPQISYHIAPANQNISKVKPVGELFARLVKEAENGIIIDPFSRNTNFTPFSNDINPQTSANYHMDAADFLQMLYEKGLKADLVIFDPPFSPRQNKSTYHLKLPDIRKTIARCKPIIARLVKINGKVVSSGWTANGIGKWRGFEPLEFMTVNHCSLRYATTILVERKIFEPIEVEWKRTKEVSVKTFNNNITSKRITFLKKALNWMN